MEGCLYKLSLLFYGLFYHLEDAGVVDLNNPLHLCALQYVYQPRIEQSLQSFQDSWNHHPLSSAGSSTPLQLWTAGLLLNAGSDHAAIMELLKSPLVLQNDSPDEGDSGADSDRSDSESVTQHELSHTDPLANSPCYGVDLYAQALQTLLS